MDACSANPCLNGGTCQSTADGNDFFCICPNNYNGVYCQSNSKIVLDIDFFNITN